MSFSSSLCFLFEKTSTEENRIAATRKASSSSSSSSSSSPNRWHTFFVVVVSKRSPAAAAAVAAAAETRILSLSLKVVIFFNNTTVGCGKERDKKREKKSSKEETKKNEKFDRTGKGSRIPKKGEIFQKTLRTKISLATRNALQKLTLFYTFRRRRRRRRRSEETRRRRHERVGRESVKARRTVEDPRGTTTTTRELHRETGDVGVFLFLVGAWSFFIGENRSAAERRKGVVLVVVVVVVVQPSSISSSVEHTQSLTQNNTDLLLLKQASKHPDDVVIVCALRTPITRARKGGLKDTTADDLVATVLRACLRETNVDANDIGDVVVGSVLGDSSQRANECRIGMFLAGFPVKVPVRTVNRQCSSGLQACADVASAIKAGYYDVGIAAGVETMSKNPMKWDRISIRKRRV